MSEPTPSTELVIPGIMEVVSLDDAKAVALALDGVRDLERQLYPVKQELTRALVHASQVHGSKTMHFPGVSVEIKGGSETVYDAEAIEEALREAGMPEERIREIVVETVTYKVAAVKAKQAAGANPIYAEIVEEFSEVRDKALSATISLKK